MPRYLHDYGMGISVQELIGGNRVWVRTEDLEILLSRIFVNFVKY